MRRARRVFPPGFLWGSSICAYQSEGGNDNCDWWAHERQPGTPAVEPCGIACDSFNRFREDWRLAADSGQNAVRFSVEWARIEPRPGEFSSAAIDHYREVAGAAKACGLKTLVTLHHFTNPLWFAEGGGWTTDESAAVFERYVRAALRGLGDLIDVVNTINEPQVVAGAGYLFGSFPPRARDLSLMQRVTANLLKAHGWATRSAHELTEAPVGLPLALMDYIPVDASEEARHYRDSVHHLGAGVYLDALRDGWICGLAVPDEEVAGLKDSDFVGVQYYTRMICDPKHALLSQSTVVSESMLTEARGGRDSSERLTQIGYPWHPQGLGRVLDDAAKSDLPLYVTENGIATENDEERVEFVALHLEQVLNAIDRGVDVRGYFYWSLLDNFEWNMGYGPKFGLIAVDRSTMERIPKPSLTWYGRVARTNGFEA